MATARKFIVTVSAKGQVIVLSAIRKQGDGVPAQIFFSRKPRRRAAQTYAYLCRYAASGRIRVPGPRRQAKEAGGNGRGCARRSTPLGTALKP